MTIKIAVTRCDVGAAIHAGGDPQRETAIIEITGDQVPVLLKEYIEHEARCEVDRKFCHQSISFSLVVE